MKAFISLAIALSLTTVGSAQWNTFHGDDQRSGFTSTIGPEALVLKWKASVGGPVVTSPIVGKDGTIYLGPVLQDTKHPSYDILAINPDGTIKWRYKTAFKDAVVQTVSTPALDAEGNLFVGTPDQRFLSLTPSGTLRWQVRAKTPVIQNPVIDASGNVYVGIDGKLTKFSNSGAVLWKRPGLTNFPGGPSLAKDGTVYSYYYATGQWGDYATLEAYDPDGGHKWSGMLDVYFWPVAAPTVAPNGTIYVAANNLWAYNPDGTEKFWSVIEWGMSNYASLACDDLGDLYYSVGINAYKISGETGGVVWTKNLTPDGHVNGKTFSSVLVDGQRRVFLGLGDGKRWAIDYEKQLLVLKGSDGSQINATQFPEAIGATSPALASDRTLYIGCLDGTLYAFKP